MGEKVRMWTPETFQTEMEYSIPREILNPVNHVLSRLSSDNRTTITLHKG